MVFQTTTGMLRQTPDLKAGDEQAIQRADGVGEPIGIK